MVNDEQYESYVDSAELLMGWDEHFTKCSWDTPNNVLYSLWIGRLSWVGDKLIQLYQGINIWWNTQSNKQARLAKAISDNQKFTIDQIRELTNTY